jgi:hypothetical protein
MAKQTISIGTGVNTGDGETVTAVNNSAITWFNGCMIRGA